MAKNRTDPHTTIEKQGLEGSLEIQPPAQSSKHQHQIRRDKTDCLTGLLLPLSIWTFSDYTEFFPNSAVVSLRWFKFAMRTVSVDMCGYDMAAVLGSLWFANSAFLHPQPMYIEMVGLFLWQHWDLTQVPVYLEMPLGRKCCAIKKMTLWLRKKYISQVPTQHRKTQFHGVRAVAPGKLIIVGLLFFLPLQQQIWLGVWGIALTVVNSRTLFLLGLYTEPINLTKCIFIQHAKKWLCLIRNFLCPKKKIQVRKRGVRLYKVAIYIKPGQETVLWAGSN